MRSNRIKGINKMSPFWGTFYLFFYSDENGKFDCPVRRVKRASWLAHFRAEGQAHKLKVCGQSHQGPLLIIQRPECRNPKTDAGHDGETPHDRAFLVGGAEEHRRRIECEV